MNCKYSLFINVMINSTETDYVPLLILNVYFWTEKETFPSKVIELKNIILRLE